LSLLHHEYATEARNGRKTPYAYRTFCENYGKYAKKYKLTMPIRRKTGEVMEVDWAGTTLQISDRSTGDRIPALYRFLKLFTVLCYSLHINFFLFSGALCNVHSKSRFFFVLKTDV
jgi:hypothetical protein